MRKLKHIYTASMLKKNRGLHSTSHYSKDFWNETLKYHSAHMHRIGKIYELIIVGFIYTDNVIAARVLLDKNSEGHQSFENSDHLSERQINGNGRRTYGDNIEINSGSERFPFILKRSKIPKYILNPMASPLPTFVPTNFSINEMKPPNYIHHSQNNYQGISQKTSPNFAHNSTSLHITIAHTSQATPVQAKNDLECVSELESQIFNSHDNNDNLYPLSQQEHRKYDNVYKFPFGIVSCLGERYWVVYLDKWLRVPSIFNARLQI
ncbi:unnamed protein product [Gordionus sp. m RMFG-2023]|uniref:uncharacterized protein LOC135926608 n=1 Tax=Gordionus sp. m RMFG-2023 TaxID=3053472 RepID=UPI0030E38F51